MRVSSVEIYSTEKNIGEHTITPKGDESLFIDVGANHIRITRQTSEGKKHTILPMHTFTYVKYEEAPSRFG